MFSVAHDADDLDGDAVAVFEVAPHGLLGVEEAAGEFLVDDGDGGRLWRIGKAYVASREQRSSAAAK